MKGNLFHNIGVYLLTPYIAGIIRGINGIENIPDKRFVIASNHTSYIEPVILKWFFFKHMRKIVFYLTKKEAYNNPLKKFFFESVGTIMVDRQNNDIVALENAINKINKGEIIGIFPEGTRSRDGKLHRGKTGAVRIALQSKCPILPIGIKNADKIWPPHRKLPTYKKTIIINIGEPIKLDEYYNKEINQVLLRKLTREIMMKIAKLSSQEYVE